MSEQNQKSYGQVSYEAFVKFNNWKDEFKDEPTRRQEAEEAAARAVLAAAVERGEYRKVEAPKPQRTPGQRLFEDVYARKCEGAVWDNTYPETREGFEAMAANYQFPPEPEPGLALFIALQIAVYGKDAYGWDNLKDKERLAYNIVARHCNLDAIKAELAKEGK